MRILIAVTGMASAVSALILELFYPEKPILTVVLSIVALVLLATFSLSYFEAFRAFSRKRSTQLGLNSVLMVVFFVFITIMINLIVYQYYFRYDLSSSRKFTLSPQTESIVRDLDRKLEVLAFIRGEKAGYDYVFSLLEGYRYFSHKLVFSIYDLDSVPAIAQQYGVTEYNTSVITDEDRHVKVDGVDEESITNGIIRITRKELKAVYFVEGHGEHSVADESRTGLKKAAESLKAMGFNVRTLNLAGVEVIPEDAAAVIIPGPTTGFTEREAGMLNSYSSEGRVLLLLDLKGEHLEGFLAGFTISLDKYFVLEPEKKMAGADETIPLIDSYPSSPVIGRFSLTTVYPTVMPVKSAGGGLFEFIPIVKSSGKSFIRFTGPQGRENMVEGPFTLAALVRSIKTGGRLILFADSDFITNEYFNITGNVNIFRNAVSYLAGETDLVSISPEKTEFVPLYITEPQADTITYVFMVGLPLAVAVAGGMMWLKRRRL